MANGFPAVAFAGASAAGRIGLAVLPGAIATPIGLGIIAGLAGVIGFGILYNWLNQPVPWSGTFMMWDPNKNEWVPYVQPFEREIPIFPGDVDAAYETVDAFDRMPFELVEIKELQTEGRMLYRGYLTGWTVACGPISPTQSGYVPCGLQDGNHSCGGTVGVPCGTPCFVGNCAATRVEYAFIRVPPFACTKFYYQAWNKGPVAIDACSGVTPGSIPIPRPVEAGATGIANDFIQSPYYALPFDLPIKAPGEVRNPPRIFPLPGVRPVAPVNPAFPGNLNPPMDLPVVLPGVGAIPGVTSPPIVEIIIPSVPAPGDTIVINTPPPGQTGSPPEKGKKEVKLKGKIAVGIKFIANQVTEFRDFVRALWKALPKEKRKCKRRCTMQQMIRDLADNVDYMWGNEAWVKEALVQVITNEIQDNFYGAGGRAFRQAAQKLRDQGLWGDVKGFQTGEGYRPKAKQTDTVFDLEVNVRRLVNLIWN